jgi:hypothetical protein
MSARAVAVIRPAATIIARLAFLYILSGQGRPVERFKGLILKSICKKQKIQWLLTAEQCAMPVAEERCRTLTPIALSCPQLTGAEEQLAVGSHCHQDTG